MITKNFKNILALVLESFANNSGSSAQLRAVNISGNTVYMIPQFSQFPGNVTTNITITSSSSYAGICVGTGNTPATENDYKLESRITSGLTATSPTRLFSLDANGNPQIEYIFTLTNTTASDIVVREIGYVQIFQANTNQGASSGSSNYFLLDRTVLENPVTIPANNGYAAIKYTLKTVVAS